MDIQNISQTSSAVPTSSLAAVAARLDTAENRLAAAEHNIKSGRRKLRVTWTVSTLAAVAMLTIGWHKDAIAQGYGITLAQAATRIAALENKTQDMTRVIDSRTNQPTVRFSKINVQIVDGTGFTNGMQNTTQSGLGNLIIGYNEKRGDNTDVRTGSHNLIAGLYNNYSGSGGVVFGYNNSIRDWEACVVGGGYNTASNTGAAVSGGEHNTSSGVLSCVSGGHFNTASGDLSSVSGGQLNTASSDYSGVSGGYQNTASGQYSSVSGGRQSLSSGTYSSMSGGEYNTASGLASSVSGGYRNTASSGVSGNEASSVSGGTYNVASGNQTSISGGYGRSSSVQYGWLAGSQSNTAISGNFTSP